jgi:TetR/AcrR family transcriptional repressor of nem operon
MKDRKDTREQLVEAAYKLSRVKGFDRMSVSEVIAEAGVKRGSLYHFFPGKDDLGLAVLERDRPDFMTMLDSTLSPTIGPDKALETFFKEALRKHSETGFVGGCLWGNTALEMSDTNPAYTKLVAEVFNEWVTRLENVIRRGQEQGVFRADSSARNIAQMIVAGIEGGIMMSRLTKSPQPFETCLKTLRKCICLN